MNYYKIHPNKKKRKVVFGKLIKHKLTKITGLDCGIDGYGLLLVCEDGSILGKSVTNNFKVSYSTKEQRKENYKLMHKAIMQL